MARQKPFADRRHAGRLLAERLVERKYVDPVVLALPRGGVPVAVEIARALQAPLDLVLVRKIGLPGHSELAAAAIVDGGEGDIVINEEIVADAGVSRRYIRELAKIELAEIERRRQHYLAGRERIPLAGRTVIVVDDGIATGASIRAALKSLRGRQPKRIVLAVPVASAASLDELADSVDELICLLTPRPFYSVGTHYADFTQLSDALVIDLLRQAAVDVPAG